MFRLRASAKNLLSTTMAALLHPPPSDLRIFRRFTQIATFIRRRPVDLSLLPSRIPNRLLLAHCFELDS